MALPLHGGNLAFAARAFPAAPTPWLDLSTGLNPWRYPSDERIDWQRLPEPAAVDALEEAARAYYRVPDARAVVAVGGVEQAIWHLPQLLGEGPAAIISPTYGSHAAAWGRNAIHLPSLDDIPKTARFAIAVSPNNPDGRQLSRAAFSRLAQLMAARGGLLIADRSFADCEDHAALQGPGIELRSFGKFFGLAGLRLGFVIADMDIAARLRERRGAWPLHSAALAIGTKALRDEVWQNNARQILRKARHRLDDVLAPHMAILGGTDLFRLGDVSDAGSLFTHLGTHGILTRIFDYNPRWIRFGLPPDDTGFIRLQSALDAFAKDRL